MGVVSGEGVVMYASSPKFFRIGPDCASYQRVAMMAVAWSVRHSFNVHTEPRNKQIPLQGRGCEVSRLRVVVVVGSSRCSACGVLLVTTGNPKRLPRCRRFPWYYEPRIEKKTPSDFTLRGKPLWGAVFPLDSTASCRRMAVLYEHEANIPQTPPSGQGTCHDSSFHAP